MHEVLGSVFSGGGSPLADAVAIAIALVVFAALYYAIELVDRI